jgi:hypothetical protein
MSDDLNAQQRVALSNLHNALVEAGVHGVLDKLQAVYCQDDVSSDLFRGAVETMAYANLGAVD